MSTPNPPTVTSVSPAKGSLYGNTKITVTGTGFSNVSAVNFGVKGGGNIEVLSDTTLTVTNPDTGTPGIVNVTVIANGLTSPTSDKDQFDYCIPEITGLNPSSSSLAGGESVTISGHYFTGCKAVNFGSAGGTSVVVLSDNKLTVTNPPRPKNETLDVTAIVQGKASAICDADKFTYSSALAPGVPLVFSGARPDATFIQFIGDESLDGYYCDPTGEKMPLAPNTAYSLASITSTKSVVDHVPSGVPAVLVKAFSGRVYINFGLNGLQGMSKSYTPSAGESGDVNFYTRYQYFEPTIKNSQINVDLSYIDFSAISLSLKAQNAANAANPVQISQSSLKLATAAGAAASQSDGSVLPEAADQLPSDSFARVISPQLAASELYHDFTHYLTETLKGVSVIISGTYVGTGKQPSGSSLTQAQSYEYKAVFDGSGNVTLTPVTGSGNGQAAGVPAVQRGTGVGDNTGDITITFDDLNAQTGIYGCNTPYTRHGVTTKGVTNDIYGQVVGDLLAGLNFGYVGSPIPFKHRAIGSLTSTEWWGGVTPDGVAVPSDATPGGNGIYFSAVQSDAQNYNSYAASISQLTTGYGFPLQDRLGRNLMSMNTATDPKAYLEVWIDSTPS